MTTKIRNQSKLAKVGWSILLVISALLVLNGALWFFFGSQRVVAPLEAFPQAYPSIAPQMAQNARQVALWYLAFGSLALIVTVEGFRRRSRWAWYATWILVAVLAAVGVLYLGGFGVILLGLAVIALVGQLLAWKRLSPQSREGAGGIEGYAK